VIDSISSSRIRAASTLGLGTLVVFAACSVFEPPEATSDGGGVGGLNTGGQNDANPDTSSGGGTTGGTAGNGGSSGSAGAGGGSGGDAGPTGPWWPYVTPNGCDSAGVPTSADRPEFSDPGGPLPPIYLATSRMRFGSANDDDALTANDKAWLDIGLDLDTSCTNSPTCSGTDGGLINETACKNDLVVPFDGKNCRDNQIGKLYPVAALSPFVGPLFGVTEPNWNCALHRGEFAVFLKLSDYNGQPNDDSVRVDVYTSIGLQTLQSWSCTSGPGGTVPPNWFNQAPWLSNAHWKIASRSISLTAPDAGSDLPDSKFADPAAFVRNGYLFTSLPPGTEFWLDGERAHIPGFRLILHRTILISKLEKQLDGTWSLLEGTVAGVVLPNEILSSFRELGFCQNMCSAYDNVVLYLNTNQDALSNTTAKLPQTPCNSLTIGIAFEARQATATVNDIEDVDPPVDCPKPKHPSAPQHGCICPGPTGGPCVLPDGGGDGG
jgi:hypothetical protein